MSCRDVNGDFKDKKKNIISFDDNRENVLDVKEKIDVVMRK